MPEEIDLNALIQDNAAEQKAEIARQAEQQAEFNARAKQQMEQSRAARQPEWEKLQTQQAEVQAIEPPKLTRPPIAPNTQEMLQPSSLQKQFGMASVFALLSVGIAKGSAIYGLKALGGFLEGAHQGNVERAGAALKDYNAKMEEVRATNEAALAEYNAIFNNKKYDFETQERMFKLKSLEFNDEAAMVAMEQGGMKAVHQLNRDRSKVDFQMAQELLKNKQIEAQMEHYASMERRAELESKKGAEGITEAQIAKIEDQARQEVSAALPRDQLGNIMLGPEWGKTIEERTRKFQVLVDKRKREIAAQRGLGAIFSKEPVPAPVKEDPTMALRHAISSGEIKKDTKAAMEFLTKRGVPPTEAAAIIQRIASGGTEY